MAAAIENGHDRVNGRRWGIVIGLTAAWCALRLSFLCTFSSGLFGSAAPTRETITESIATNGKIEALNNFEAYAPHGHHGRKKKLCAGRVRG